MPRLLEFERAVQGSQRTLLVLSPAYLAEGFGQANRNLTRAEWNQFAGPNISYECVCPDLPPGEGAPQDACTDTH